MEGYMEPRLVKDNSLENTELEIESIKLELTELAQDLEFADNFRLLQNLMYRTAKVKGWHNPSKSFGEQILMMHTELSEVVEEYRTSEGNPQRIWHSHETALGLDKDGCTPLVYNTGTSKPEGCPIEFADLTIRELDTCEMYKIDLLDSIFVKAFFNLTRSNRHGDKKL